MPSIIKVDQIQSDTGNVAISGNVSSTLRVSNTSFPLIVRSGGTNHITMFDTRSSTGVGTMIGANQDGNTYYDSNYNGTATAGGHIWRNSGNNILTLGATGLLTTTAGIRFPATQVADADPNTLDDYEEGDWTPVWASTGNLPSLSYSTQVGKYVKIGRVVHFWGRIFMNTWGSGGTGNVRVGGLPFTVTDLGGGSSGGSLCHVIWTRSSGNIAYPANATQVLGRVMPSTTQIEYITMGNADSLGENGTIPWTSNPQMYNNYFVGTYYV